MCSAADVENLPLGPLAVDNLTKRGVAQCQRMNGGTEIALLCCVYIAVIVNPSYRQLSPTDGNKQLADPSEDSLYGMTSDMGILNSGVINIKVPPTSVDPITCCTEVTSEDTAVTVWRNK